MNATKHAKYRYVQRIVGIDDVFQAKQYAAQHDDEIQASILSMYEHASHLWTGQFHDNITRHYYIHDTVVLVTPTDNSAVVTLWRVNFGFPDVVNKKTVDGLLKEIQKLSKQVEKETEKTSAEVERRTAKIDELDARIKATEQQLQILKDERSADILELDALKRSADIVRLEIDKIASTVVASADFKKDLLEWKKA